jgi:transcriptional regulator with XRE-family HTH domain
MQYKVSLKAARVNADLNLAEAAAKLDVSISTVKNWEAKKTFPNQPMIERICAVYAIPYDMLKFF